MLSTSKIILDRKANSSNLPEKSDTTVITVIHSGAMSQDACPASVLLALRHLRHGQSWPWLGKSWNIMEILAGGCSLMVEGNGS